MIILIDDLHLLGEHGAVPEAQAAAHGVAQDDGSLPAQVVQHASEEHEPAEIIQLIINI